VELEVLEPEVEPVLDDLLPCLADVEVPELVGAVDVVVVVGAVVESDVVADPSLVVDVSVVDTSVVDVSDVVVVSPSADPVVVVESLDDVAWPVAFAWSGGLAAADPAMSMRKAANAMTNRAGGARANARSRRVIHRLLVSSSRGYGSRDPARAHWTHGKHRAGRCGRPRARKSWCPAGSAIRYGR
jgi:hypothetical protein